MKKIFLSFALAFTLSSALSQDPSIACVENLKSNSELQLLFKKMPVDVTKGQSLEVLSDDSKPSSSEKRLMVIFIESLDNCGSQGVEWRSANYPLSINNLTSKYQSDFKINAADLYGGKLTYGEFAKIRAKMMTEYIANLQIEVDKIKQARLLHDQSEAKNAQSDFERDRQRLEAAKDRELQLSAQREAMAEETRRQAVLQMLRSPPIQFQPLPLPRPPITTNCNAFGNQFNCITR